MQDDDFLYFFHSIPLPSQPSQSTLSYLDNDQNSQRITKIVTKRQKITQRHEIIQCDNFDNINGMHF